MGPFDLRARFIGDAIEWSAITLSSAETLGRQALPGIRAALTERFPDTENQTYSDDIDRLMRSIENDSEALRIIGREIKDAGSREEFLRRTGANGGSGGVLSNQAEREFLAGAVGNHREFSRALATGTTEDFGMRHISDVGLGKTAWRRGFSNLQTSLQEQFPDLDAQGIQNLMISIYRDEENMGDIGQIVRGLPDNFNYDNLESSSQGRAIIAQFEESTIKSVDALTLGRSAVPEIVAEMQSDFPGQDLSGLEQALLNDPASLRIIGNGIKEAGSSAAFREGISGEGIRSSLPANLQDDFIAGAAANTTVFSRALVSGTIANVGGQFIPDVESGREAIRQMRATPIEGLDEETKNTVLDAIEGDEEALGILGAAVENNTPEELMERIVAGMETEDSNGMTLTEEQKMQYVIAAVERDPAAFTRALVGGTAAEYVQTAAMDQLNTVAGSAANDPVTAGRNIIGTVGEAMEIDQAIIQGLQADEALMERVGRDLARNAQAATQQGQAPVAQELMNIQKLLNGEEVSGVSLLDYAGQYPSLMGAMLNAQYQQDAAGTVDMIQTTMSENLGNFSAEEQARIMAGFEGEGATTKLNEILADPEQASQMMSNISYLAGMGEGEMSPEDRETLVRSLAENSERWLYVLSNDNFIENASLMLPDEMVGRMLRNASGMGEGFGTVNILGMDFDLGFLDDMLGDLTDPRKLRFAKGFFENKMFTFGQSFEMVGSVFSGTEGMPFMDRMNRSYGAFTQTYDLFNGRVARIHGTPRPEAPPQVASAIDPDTGAPVSTDTGTGSGGDTGGAAPQVAQNDVANPNPDPAMG
tara:strand:+ start:67975 stop:70428 length:2454 start_codon:yes stop_codon:yes gene_type:complete